MAFKDELNINDRLFMYSDITVDQLLYILSKKNAVLDIIQVYQDPNIDSIKKEKIMVLIGELCDKGYAKELPDNKSIVISLNGRWRRIYTNPTYQFWGIIIAIVGTIAAIIAILPSNKEDTKSTTNTPISTDSALKSDQRKTNQISLTDTTHNADTSQRNSSNHLNKTYKIDTTQKQKN